jgi:hydroxypyruvate isomerase
MLFNEVKFIDKFKLASENGFKGIEYLFPYDYSKSDIKDQLSDNNLSQILFDFPAGNFAEGERGIAIFPERKNEFREGVHKAIEYATFLNCDRLTVLVGIADGKYTTEQYNETLIENLLYAADQVKNTNITILVEALNTIDAPNYFVSSTSHCKEIIKAVNLQSVKIQYDIYHMQIMEGDIIRTFENNFDKIGHIQIADNPGRNEPGTGELNYKKIFEYLNNSDYDGWIGCEYAPKNNTLQSLKWIREYGVMNA